MRLKQTLLVQNITEKRNTVTHICVKLSGASRFCTLQVSQYLIYIKVIVVHLLSYVIFILTKGFYKWLQWICVYLLHLDIFLTNPLSCHLVGLVYIVNRQLIGLNNVTIVPAKGCLIGIGIYTLSTTVHFVWQPAVLPQSWNL